MNTMYAFNTDYNSVLSTNEAKLNHANEFIKATLWLYRDDVKHGDISRLERTLEFFDLYDLYKKYVVSCNRTGQIADDFERYVEKFRQTYKIPLINMKTQYDHYTDTCERTGVTAIPIDDFAANYLEMNKYVAKMYPPKEIAAAEQEPEYELD